MDEYLNICIYFNFGELKKKTKNEKNVGEFGLFFFLIFRITFMNLSVHRCIKDTFLFRMHFVSLFYDEN